MADPQGTFYAISPDVKTGYGAELLVGVGDGSPETFNALRGVVSIGFGSLDTAVIDVTHLRSVNAAHEKTAGMRDFGAFPVKLRWLPGDDSQRNQAGNLSTLAPGLLYLNIQRSHWNFVVRLYDGSPASEYPFSGIVTKFQPGEINTDGSIDLDVEITPDQDYSGGL